MEKSSLTVRQAALDLLARREHARSELRKKLIRRFPLGEIEASLEQLAAEGLQSDYRYACSYVRERVLRGYGPLRIRSELQLREVNSDLVDTAIADTCEREGFDWTELARGALQRKFGARELPPLWVQRARYLRFLQYRGFPPSSVGGDD